MTTTKADPKPRVPAKWGNEPIGQRMAITLYDGEGLIIARVEDYDDDPPGQAVMTATAIIEAFAQRDELAGVLRECERELANVYNNRNKCNLTLNSIDGVCRAAKSARAALAKIGAK